MRKILSLLLLFVSPHLFGQLTVICGPMFSGKTKRLIDLYHTNQHKKVLVCKHALDSRLQDHLVSRATPERIPALPIASVDQLSDVYKPFDVIIIDEAQFFSQDMSIFLQKISAEGKEVYIGCLDLDFRGYPFGECIVDLMKNADHVIQLNALCSVCRRVEAPFTQRLINNMPASASDPLIVIDDGSHPSVTYEPRCRFCYRTPR